MSNTPVKNGAIIFLRDHGEFYRCDAYEMEIRLPTMGGFETGYAYYFRINEASCAYHDDYGAADYIIDDFDSWFGRTDPHSTMICTPEQVTKL